MQAAAVPAKFAFATSDHCQLSHKGLSTGMLRIGLISDTHGFLDPLVFEYFEKCDEIWHAGDFGTKDVADQLAEFRPFKGVFGNIDDGAIRDVYPEHLRFDCEQLDVWMTHIGGYPGRYDRRVSKEIRANPPGLFICGHSHILRAMRDGNLVHLNPGAAGHHGFHLERTLMRFEVHGAKIRELEVIELGARGKTTADEAS